MPGHDNGKERSVRPPLDLHKSLPALEYWKELLGFLALLATMAWVIFHLAVGGQHDFQASRGPVATVHQAWDTQCLACHVEFTPISSHSWAAPFLGAAKESSQRCQNCHEGPAHHAGQKPDLSCGSCHREHRGREASLVNLPDSDCTQCHQDMSQHTTAKIQFLSDVARFSKDAHPEFSSLKTDPGNLKFNHRLHLTPGMAIGKGGGTIKTLGQIPQPQRERYRNQPWQQETHDQAPVHLACASCHQLDSGDFGVTTAQAKEFPLNLLGRRNSGAYMLPIAYENQCQACHPLTVALKIPADPKAGSLTIPHRLPSAEIHDLVENFFTAQLARGQAGFDEKKLIRPLPGKLLDLLAPTVRAQIAKDVEMVETSLYQSKQACAECHSFEGKSLPRVVPTQVPQVWLKHAKFNHTAHRAMQCTDCHAAAETSGKHTDVLIPGRDNCIQCHAPATSRGTPGARFNCTQCHLYHNGEHALQGVGAVRRGPKVTRGIEDFLAGK